MEYVLRSGRVKGNGALLQRASYPRLFEWVQDNQATVVTTEALWANNKHLYTLGDGSTTFRVPDLRGKWLQAADSVGALAAGLPNITGDINPVVSWGTATHGALSFKRTFACDVSGSTHSGGTMNFNAKQSSPLYRDDIDTVQPPSIQLIAQIKY